MVHAQALLQSCAWFAAALNELTVLKTQLRGPGFGNFIAWSADKVPGDFKA